jgi:hypothetical protein
MIKGWNYLTIAYGILATLFIGILFFGESNMFTIPIALVFAVGTIYCVMQWHLMGLFKKIEAKHPKWK